MHRAQRPMWPIAMLAIAVALVCLVAAWSPWATPSTPASDAEDAAVAAAGAPAPLVLPEGAKVLIFGDFQQADWRPAGERATELRKAADAIGKGATVRLFDAARPPESNTSVTGLAVDAPLVAVREEGRDLGPADGDDAERQAEPGAAQPRGQGLAELRA